MKTRVVTLLSACLVAATGHAQTYSLDPHIIAGGGGTSAGGGSELSGTIGQPLVGVSIADGALSLQSGFWPSFAPSVASITIFDNLSGEANSVQYATSDSWLAGKLCIRTQAYSLESVTLQLDTRQPAERPSVRLRLYSHDPVGDRPAADTGLVLNLAGTTNPIVWRFVPSTYAQMVKWVPETPFILEADRCYWVVLSAEDGEVLRWISTTLPSGPAGTYGRTSSPDAGGTWAQADNTTNYRMLVKATAASDSAAPPLAAERNETAVRILWPRPATGFVLDRSSTVTGMWSQVAFPYTTNATDISITVSAPIGNQFYRLRKE